MGFGVKGARARTAGFNVSNGQNEDWTYKLARVAGMLGFNEMRVRWKLMQLQKKRRQSDQAAEARSEQEAYAHQICSRCGALNDQSESDCMRCGRALPSKAERAVASFGVSPTMAIGVGVVIIYLHMWVESGGGFLSPFSARFLEPWGSGDPRLTLAGEWWRLATPMFLHGGLLHVGFNVYALFIVGPPIERIYGRSRFCLFYFVTGIVASLASVYGELWMLGTMTPSVGASGAIMGLLGIAAGWGHRQGTPFGKELRNQMLKWGAFVVLFGMFINGDNFAHVGGFVAGAVLGLLPLEPGRRNAGYLVGKFLDTVCILALVATFVVTVVPLTSKLPQSGNSIPTRATDLEDWLEQ